MKDMFEMMSPPPLMLLPVKAPATLPMISEIDGKIAPAIMAEKVPTNRRALSYSVMYVKNFVRLTYSATSSS